MEKIINLNQKHFFLLSFSIYSFGFFLSLVLTLILNFSFGKMDFTNEIDLGGWQEIFIHNVSIDLMIIGGGLLLGIPAIFILIINGLLLGALLGQSIINDQWFYFIATIAPNGVFEMIGFILSGSIFIQIARQLVFYKYTPVNN